MHSPNILLLSLCRALLVQFGFYMHIQHVLGTTHYVMSRPVVFATSFMLLFSVVIALFKDIPDIQGDRQVSSLGATPLDCISTCVQLSGRQIGVLQAVMPLPDCTCLQSVQPAMGVQLAWTLAARQLTQNCIIGGMAVARVLTWMAACCLAGGREDIQRSGRGTARVLDVHRCPGGCLPGRHCSRLELAGDLADSLAMQPGGLSPSLHGTAIWCTCTVDEDCTRNIKGFADACRCITAILQYDMQV